MLAMELELYQIDSSSCFTFALEKIALELIATLSALPARLLSPRRALVSKIDTDEPA